MTDGTLRAPADLDRLTFDDQGLLPVVAQDASSGRVLMLAWANREALDRTLETGEAHFWSRSREALWRKGETSGNVLRLISLNADCDGDAVLALVEPAGPVCHTGDISCFGEGAASARLSAARSILTELDALIAVRDAERPDGSYTTKLLADENLRLKKLGEETAELIAALARRESDRIPEEAADLLYHALVALRGADVSLDRVFAVLEARKG